MELILLLFGFVSIILSGIGFGNSLVKNAIENKNHFISLIEVIIIFIIAYFFIPLKLLILSMIFFLIGILISLLILNTIDE